MKSHRTIHQIRSDIDDLNRQLEHGCGNHGCRIEKPQGQATNGPCHCSPAKIAKRMFDIALELEAMGLNWIHNQHKE